MNMMKKVLWIVLFAVGITLSATAQTQQGYVKTKGRLGANGQVIAGKRLSGVVVQVKGRSAVVSKDNGAFSFPIPADHFMIQNVKKQGYVLTDPEVIYKQYSYSTNPIVLVMETPQQQTEDKLANERKIRRNLQRQLQAKEDEIEELKEQNMITREEYQLRLQQLYAQQENNEKLISEMAERYSQLDFDQLDEFNQRISDCILNGRLTEADSLLRSKGDINNRIARYNMHHAANIEAQQTLDKSISMEQKDLEDIAQDCYHYYETFLMKHQNDSAGHYLNLRAELDTTNLTWQKEAGKFNYQYLSQSEPAKRYLQRGLRQSIAQYGELNEWTADFLYHIGRAYSRANSSIPKAEEYFYKAIEIWSQVQGDDYPQIASAYNGLGRIYFFTGEKDKALELQYKALDIQERKLGIDNEYTAESYLYLGSLFSDKKDFDKALEYSFKALEIWRNIFGEQHPNIGSAYYAIGTILYKKGDFDNAIDYYLKSLDLYETTLGKNHPGTLQIYDAASDTYIKLGNFDKAIDYLQKKLSICESSLGPEHISSECFKIGIVYSTHGDYDKALEYYFKTLPYYTSLLEEGDINWSALYSKIAEAYYGLRDCDKAVEYYTKAINNLEKSTEANSSSAFLSWLYQQVGEMYYSMSEYDKAIEYYSKSLPIIEKTQDDSYPYLAVAYIRIGNAYVHQEDNLKGHEFFMKALPLLEGKYGENNEFILAAYTGIGETHFNLGNYKEALEYCTKAYDGYYKIYGPDYSTVQELKEAIDKCREMLGQ